MREQKFESRKLPLRRRWWWWQKREEVRTRELFNIHSCIICQSFLSVSLLYSHWSCLRYRDQENESQERKGIERKRRQRQKKTNAFKSRNASENEGQEETWSRDCLLTRQWTETFCRGDGFEGERVRVVVVGVKGEEIEKTEGKKSCHWLKCRVLPWSPLFSLPVNILSQSKWRETEDSSLCPRLISVTLTSLTMEGMKDLCERNKGRKREAEKKRRGRDTNGWRDDLGAGFILQNFQSVFFWFRSQSMFFLDKERREDKTSKLLRRRQRFTWTYQWKERNERRKKKDKRRILSSDDLSLSNFLLQREKWEEEKSSLAARLLTWERERKKNERLGRSSMPIECPSFLSVTLGQKSLWLLLYFLLEGDRTGITVTSIYICVSSVTTTNNINSLKWMDPDPSSPSYSSLSFFSFHLRTTD